MVGGTIFCLWGGKKVKNFFTHPIELLILAYPKNLLIIGLMVEALDDFCGRGGLPRYPSCPFQLLLNQQSNFNQIFRVSPNQ